ncbi:LysR family transcriptional regulator [Jeongeupia naejangsanensis]|uniref:LysR family transcriptional regulator n=1 Tax=Jeongeupia naejangsanensis TaxID=613195 RepID=A0ABS2BKU7_9NEIS|nr:LysR family transcriptional regulator [Jeongeupia naejangsanensis]MBM3116237.1 LysR family transcriptional regulator [Jeongeupia naejangsanensis]
MAGFDRLTGVAAFVCAVEAGSFSAAAQRMNLSRSAVGKSIARLEARIGVRLFQRTTRSQSLTDDGQLFYERCLAALGELEAAEDELEQGRREPAGRLRITLPALFGRRCVASVLLELAQRYPKLELEVAFSDRVSDLIEEGYDLAIRSGALPDSAALVGRYLGVQHMIVCAAPSYLAARGTPRTLADLAGHDGIVYGRDIRSAQWRFVDAAGGELIGAIRPCLCFDDIEAMAGAAIAGIGLTRLPYWLAAEHLQAGSLVHVLPETRSSPFPVHVVWAASRYLPYKVRLVIDALLARIPPLLIGPSPVQVP